jgi:3-mercaptopyruvate sulfurtransferase SseA
LYRKAQQQDHVQDIVRHRWSQGGPPQKIKEGATIVDVRTPDEFRSGHVQGRSTSRWTGIQDQLKKIDKSKPVITCCRSGARSGMAADELKARLRRVQRWAVDQREQPEVSIR